MVRKERAIGSQGVWSFPVAVSTIGYISPEPVPRHKSKIGAMRLLTLILLTSAFAVAAGPDQILGTWLAAGESKIEITKCGDSYCGTIVWMKSPHNDEHNEDASKRSRPLVGAQIATRLKFEGSSWSGKLYGPERGKTVDAKMTFKGDDQLEVKVSAGVARKTVIWTRSN